VWLSRCSSHHPTRHASAPANAIKPLDDRRTYLLRISETRPFEVLDCDEDKEFDFQVRVKMNRAIEKPLEAQRKKQRTQNYSSAQVQNHDPKRHGLLGSCCILGSSSCNRQEAICKFHAELLHLRNRGLPGQKATLI
jgi:hypothetical protein